MSSKGLSDIYQELKIDPKADRPIAVQLADQLVWLIASNQIKTGDRLPTIRELALFLSINMHTVRAAYLRLEANRLIETRRGLGSVILDFHPGALSENEASIRTHTVGLVVPDLAGPFYPTILKGVQQVAIKRHTLVIACGTNEDAQTLRDQIGMLIAKNIDGIILASDYLPMTNSGFSHSYDTSLFPVPLVFIDRPDHEGFNVIFDAEEAGFKATEHLLSHGHRRIALVTPPTDFPTYRLCQKGFYAALQNASIQTEIASVVETGGFSFEEGFKAMQSLLDKKEYPQAVFVAEDQLALGAMKAIRNHGLKVPDDIAVVGLNNFELGSYSDPPLTTIDTSAEELGIVAMNLMNRLINGDPIEENTITLPTKLIIRSSCGCNH